MKPKKMKSKLGYVHMAETRPAALDAQVRKFAEPQPIDEAVEDILEEEDGTD